MIRDWLKSLGLAQFAALFEENDVDFETLQVLTERDLKELGLPFGPRKRVMNALEAAKRQAADARGEAPHTPPPAREFTGEGERRQLTVLFCDMVGFTELAGGVDPEVLQKIIRRYEDACAVCITRYDGYVFQRLGDGIVAFFGYPLAHEGEAERAIRAGLEILETLALTEVPVAGRLRVRIGIATGVVVVSSAERGAIGETMSLAARLQAFAEPGQLVVSERVQRLAGGVFAYADLGEQRLKGIGKPTRAYRVVGLSAAASRFEAATHQGMTPLVGRAQEIGVLFGRWQLARTGAGQVVLLSGEAGIGKSRMVSALRERLEGEGVGTLRFQCSPFHINSAFYPCIDNIERAIAAGRDATVDDRLDKLEALVVRQYGRPIDDLRFFASLLSIPWQHRYGTRQITPRRHKEETIRALVEVTEAAARTRPTLMLFEDAHWADPSTLEVLNLLIEQLPGFPLLVLITHRPEFKSRWSDQDHVTTLDLSRLKREESRAIVARLADEKALPEELVAEIIEKADGIPLFVEELTKSVLESDNLKDTGDRYTYSGVSASMTVPATLRDSLMARLDRVTVVKEIAQVGSAIGREFSYELLAAVSPMAPAALNEGLDRLTESGLAFRRGTIPDAVFTFKHALVQDAAYASLLKSRRQELHSTIARVLEDLAPGTTATQPELLARHLTAAGLDAEAVPFWRRAGQLALERIAFPEAIAHLRTGLTRVACLPDETARDLQELELRTLLGPAIMAHRGWAAREVSSILEPAWKLTESLAHRESYLPVLHGLWVHFMTMAQLTTSIGWAEQLLSSAAAIQDEGLEICGHRAAMTSYFWLGELSKAHAHGDVILATYDPERHRHIATRTHSDPLTGDGIYRSHYLWMLGYPDQARAVSAATADHARRRNHPFDLAFALTLGAQSYAYCGEPERLLECTEEAIRVGREYGVPLMSEVMAEISLGEAWLLAGRIGEGIPQLRKSITRLADTGHRVWVAYLVARLGEAVALHGDLESGLALVEENLNRPDCREDRSHVAEVLRLKGWILREQGKYEQAEEALRASIAVAREQAAKSWELRASMTLARLLSDRGDKDAARQLLAPVYGWFSEGFDTRDLRDAKELLTLLAT